MRWSVGFQRQFGAWLAAVDYVGNHGVHLPIQKEFNAVPRQYLSTATNGYDASVNTALTRHRQQPLRRPLPQRRRRPSPSRQLLRPYPGVHLRHRLRHLGHLHLPLPPGAAQPPLRQRRLAHLGLHLVEVARRHPVPQHLRRPALVRPLAERPHLPLRHLRHLPAPLRRRPPLPRRTAASSRRSSADGRSRASTRSSPDSPSPSSPAPTASPLYLGTGAPANSAWGRSGFKTSTNNLSQTGYWFNTAYWSTTTAPTGTTGVVVARQSPPNQYQIRTLPIRFDSLRADFLNQFDAAVQRNFSLSRVYEPLSLQIRLDMINALNHPVYGAPEPARQRQPRHRLDPDHLRPGHRANQPAPHLPVRSLHPLLNQHPSTTTSGPSTRTGRSFCRSPLPLPALLACHPAAKRRDLLLLLQLLLLLLLPCRRCCRCPPFLLVIPQQSEGTCFCSCCCSCCCFCCCRCCCPRPPYSRCTRTPRKASSRPKAAHFAAAAERPPHFALPAAAFPSEFPTKTHVKPQNHLTPTFQTKYSWQFSFPQRRIMEIDQVNAAHPTQGDPLTKPSLPSPKSPACNKTPRETPRGSTVL